VGAGEKYQRLPAPAHLATRMLWRGIKQQKAPWLELVSHWESLENKRQLELLAEAHIVTREVWRGLESNELFSDDPKFLDTLAVARLLATLSVNAMTVADEEQRGIGLGIYPRGALLNHGEQPNCAQSFRGRRLIIRTLRPVAAGEELTIPYSELAELSCVRRKWLQEQYFFDPLPQGNLLTITAARDAMLAEVLECTDDGHWVRSDVGACWNAHHGILETSLGGSMDGPAGLAVLRTAHAAWLRAKRAESAGDVAAAADHFAAAWKATSTGKCRLGNCHAMRLAIARDAMDAAIDSSEWRSATIWARIVSVISRQIYDTEWPVPGLAFAKLAKLELYHGYFQKAVDAGEAALRSLTIAYEDDTDMLVELRGIVAQSQAEAGSEMQRRDPANCLPDLDFTVEVSPHSGSSGRQVEGPELPPALASRKLGAPMDGGVGASHGLVSTPSTCELKDAGGIARAVEPTSMLSELD